MGKNNVVYITIDNYKDNYYKCINYIKEILNNSALNMTFQEENNLNILIKKYTRNNIIPSKLEEPLDNVNILSSVEDVVEINESIYKNIHFHIRVNLRNDSTIERMCQLHYLALLLENYSDLVRKRRLSVFLIPNTDIKEYPYYDENCVDEKDIKNSFQELSSYLRLIIREELYGAIYSISHVKKDKKDTIVESLAIERNVITFNYSPLMIFKQINFSDINFKKNSGDNLFINSVDYTIKKYIESNKSPNKSNEEDIKPALLDNYKLVFTNNIINRYIDCIIKLNKCNRFGYSKSKNAKIALADYIFETAYRIIEKKISKIELKLTDCINVIRSSLENTNIFCFLIFSYILYFDKNNISNITITKAHNIIESFSELAKDITSGISQLIQNSLQHSSSHFCAVSLFIEERDDGYDELKIKVSDISDNDIYDTFFQNIYREKKYIQNNIINSEDKRYDICNLKSSYKRIVDLYNELEENKDKIFHKMFYNEFNEENKKGNILWKNFREIDSSAHIGLALFAQIIKRCDGDFIVNVKEKHQNIERNVSKNIKDKYSDKFLGTDYEITLPIKPVNISEFSTVTKVSYNDDITENYQSYAKFLDYSMKNASVNFQEKNTLAVLKWQETQNFTNSLQKFTNQFVWTRFWLNAFKELDINKKAYYFDLEEILRYDLAFPDDTYDEMIIKGLINAIDIYAQYIKQEIKDSEADILFAFLNLDEKLYKTLKNITISLSLKNFPEKVQLFFVYKNDCENANSYLHLIGSSYGEAVCNCFNLSIENGSKSYDNKNYYNVLQLMEPFLNNFVDETQNNNIVTKYVFPFTSFIKSKDENNLFFSDIINYAEKELINGQGYKLPHTHTRLGNKVHIDSFYEMSFVFYRTIVANRIAFEILRMMLNNKESQIRKILNNGNILFFGYASYSEAILISITDILRSYRENHNLTREYLEYAIYQYNLRTESKSDEIEIQMSNDDRNIKNVYVVQIVPISSTMTTFKKIWNTFFIDCERKGRKSYNLLCNYTAFWARSSEYSNLNTDKFYIEDKNTKNTKISDQLSDLPNVHCVQYIISGSSKWFLPETCEKCYPTEVVNEVPLVETDPTSTVPSQQIHMKKVNQNNLINVDHENNERIRDLRGFVHYGHYVRGNNHYQIYIETQKYFTKYSCKIKEWLTKLRKNNEGKNKYPCLNIIFSPEHNTNVGFSQYVNSYYFNGNAEIVSINEDKHFRTNFICEYADLKKTIERLWDDYYNLFKDYDKDKPVRFFFVDDTIISGNTYHKANSFLRSLIPEKYQQNYDSNIFEKCFILIDRLSRDSQKSYVSTLSDYHTYCHIDISNMRKQGDSCSCCKFKEEARKLFRKSATNKLAKYWRDKCIKIQEISFDKISNTDDENNISYLRVVLSHILKNILKSKLSENNLSIIIKIFGFFVCDEKDKPIWVKSNPQYSDLNDYWKELINYGSDTVKVQFDEVTVIESLIKILTRPFFIYDYNFKKAILKFMIVLSEKIINPGFNEIELDEEFVSVVRQIAKLYEENYVKMKFMEDVLFEAFSDLHSTYLIRKQTIDNLKYTVKDGYSSVWVSYSANVQRVIQGSSDETRSVRFEHLLLSDSEEYGESVLKSDNNILTSRFKDIFYKELFLLNGHIYFDEMKRICETESYNKKYEQMMDRNVYYLERMKKIREMDNVYLKKVWTNKTNLQIIGGECGLYNLLYKEKNSEVSIERRYELLLKQIKNMLSFRYELSNNDLKIAILTSYENMKNNMSGLQVIKMIYDESDSNMIRARFKYEVKRRILDNCEDCSIINNGYSVILDQDHDPYFIIYFDNTLENEKEPKLNVGRTVRKICPVYLYVEIHTDTKELLWFAMRDILSYRDSILAYLEDDFTSDVLSEYARLTLTEAIFNAERAISHTSMISDKKELETLLGIKSDHFYQEHNELYVKNKIIKHFIPFTKELALEWAYAKNFSNTYIAKLYNHMLIYINSNVNDIIKDKTVDPMSSKLYVKTEYNDGITVAAKRIIDLLPKSKEKEIDGIYSLFSQIINFEVSKELDDSVVYYSHNEDGEMFTYNVEYIKGIIYRIIFDALSNTPDVNDTKFIENISGHYRNLNALSLLQSREGNVKILNSLRNANDKARFEKCQVKFYMEKNENINNNFHWLVIENTLGSNVEYKMEEIYRKLEDPIDYNDGHISLVASHEYICKLHKRFDFPIKKMYNVEQGKKFITKLPIIRKDR